jgi:hypothetical protein
MNRLPGFDLLLLITADAGMKNMRIHESNSGFPRPGNRSARSVMDEMARCANSSYSSQTRNSSSEKLLGNFIESIFGSYFNPVSAENDFVTGFTERLGGKKIYSARRFVFNSENQLLTGYIALFCENSNLLSKAFKQASKNCPADMRCSLQWLATRPYPFVRESGSNRMRIKAPIAIELLKSGYHSQKDFVRQALQKGLMRKKPAIYPFFVIESNAEITDSDKTRSAFACLCCSLKDFTRTRLLEPPSERDFFFQSFWQPLCRLRFFSFLPIVISSNPCSFGVLS